MPKRSIRSRRKAAPVDLTEPDNNLHATELSDEPQPSVLPALYRPQARRRGRAPRVLSSTNSTIQLASNMPSADDIASSLMLKLRDSGLQLSNSIPSNQPVDVSTTLARTFNEPIETSLRTSGPTIIQQDTSNINVAPCINNNAIQQPLFGPTVNQPLQRTSANIQSQNLINSMLQPPVTTDPNLTFSSEHSTSADNNSLGIADNLVNRSLSVHVPILKHYLPLDFHVNDKMIWAEQYIDFACLLPNNQCEDDNNILLETLNVTITGRKNVNKKELLSILQWTNAFDIFMSIYLSKFPDLILALIKYGFNIRSMSKQFGFPAVKIYDENFRRVRKLMNLNWDQINDELWRMAAFPNNYSPQGISRNPQFKSGKNIVNPFQRRAQQQFPNGYCWAFCRSGVCTEQSCKLKHQCVHCGKKHGTISCKEGFTKPSAPAKSAPHTYKGK